MNFMHGSLEGPAVSSASLSSVLTGAARCYPRRPVLSKPQPKAIPYYESQYRSPMAHLKPVPDPYWAVAQQGRG